MMKINKNEQEFVLKYFQPGKLDTRKALQKVKARVGIADKEVSHAATVSLRMRRIRWIAVAASILVLFTIGAYTLLQPKTVTLSAESEVVAYHLPDGTKVSLMPHSSLSYQEDDCRKVEMKGCIYYQVKHDEQHPFDVVGEHGHVRVLGTQFMVDERTDVPEVMVTSGKVLFTARHSAEGVFLTKGKRARLLTGLPSLSCWRIMISTMWHGLRIACISTILHYQKYWRIFLNYLVQDIRLLMRASV